MIDSVSKAFYEQGWRGIHVEPVEEYAALLRSDRPDETVIQAIVSRQAGVVKFYKIPSSGLSTVSEEIANEHKSKMGVPIIETLVTSVTLDDVLNLASRDEIHWLKIDVEGHEHDVLDGWRDSPQRPWVIVIESTWPNTPNDTSVEWEELVLAKGYQCVYMDGLNRFYLHSTHKELRSLFALPPNIFDGFQLAGTSSVWTASLVKQHKKQIEMLEEELTKAQGQARQLEVEYHQFKGEASKQEEILKRLAEQAMTRQQNVLTEQLKAIIERERAHAEKVEGLREEWRRAEAGIRGEAQAQKKAELEEILRKWEAEREKLEGQLLERAGQLEEARRALDRLREELAERERAHAEKVEGLREEWRRAEAGIRG
ncbi:MAG: FkbM family methyltransferase, partial [Chthoniobacterales bacterium]|nr:FkbM family methyltransferase [Chthoniobacterales bacterium]